MRKILIVVILIAIAAAIYTQRVNQDSAVSESKPESEPTEQIAVTPLKSGVNLNNMDRSVNPADDIYRYVHGTWLDNTEIPAEFSSYSVYTEVFEEVEKQLRQIIEEAAANAANAEPGTEQQQVGELYATFMDEETIEQRGLSVMQEYFDSVAAISNTDELVDHMVSDMNRGMGSAPFGYYVYGDMRNSTMNAVYLYQSGISLPNRDFYLDLDNERFKAAREALPGYIESLLSLAGVENAAERAQGIMAIETQLAESQRSIVDNRVAEKRYNPYAPAKLSELNDRIDWLKMMTDLELAGEEYVIVSQPEFFTALPNILLDNPLEDWKAYMIFHVLDASATHLNSAVRDARFNFRGRILSGREEQTPRYRQAIGIVNGSIGEAVGKLYVQKHFPPEAKAKMEEMVENVIATFDKSLDTLEWMSPETRLAAKEKLSKFTYKIGYPDVWTDYSSIEIIPGDHAGNIMRIRAWQVADQKADIGQPVNKDDWGMTPQTVNAYYSPTNNEIVFPAARLQPPFFQLDADDAFNYGAVGGVIGHEISHGFDDQGSKYDGDGNLRNWWTDADRKAFEERTAKLIEQYNEFEPIKGMFINGAATAGENIGDLSGVTMAYKAYIASLDGEEAPVIDGFTGPQRFFIGYATSRKGKSREQAMINRLASGVHSPLPWRVIGIYRNMPEFYEAFDVGPENKLYLPPEERVKLW